MKNCPKCGAEMNDDDRFCTGCGEEFEEPACMEEAEASAVQETDPAEETVQEAVPEQTKKKIKWWMIAIPVVLAAAVLIACFWNRIVFAVAPQTVFAKAAATTAAELVQRCDGNPLELVKAAFDETGKNTTALSMEMIEDSSKTEICVDWNMRSDAIAMQQSSDINISAPDLSIDLSTYIDTDCLTLGASILNDGQPYGITFATVREDVEKSELFASLTEEQKANFAEFIETLADQMDSAALSQTELDEINARYLAVIRDAVSGLTMEKQWKKLELNGTTKNCAVVSFTMTQAEIADLWDGLLDVAEQDQRLLAQSEVSAKLYEETGEEPPVDAWFAEMREAVNVLRKESQVTGTVSYYISGGKLLNVGVDINYAATDNNFTLDLDVLLGENPAAEDIIATCLYTGAEGTTDMRLVLETRNEEGLRGDSLRFHAARQDGKQTELTASYLWNTVTGDMDLAFVITGAAADEDVSLGHTVNLAPVQDGFALDLGNLALLIGQISDAAEFDPSDVVLNVSLSVVKGCEITKPEYINLDQLSLYDLYKMLAKLYGSY